MMKVWVRCAALCVAGYAAYGAPVSYHFSATTRGTEGSPAHLEQFQLTAPSFLPLVTNGPLISMLSDDPALMSCDACVNPPVAALHFLRGGAGDMIQFRDADGILRPYFFEANALSHPGTYQTLPGINVNVGELTVDGVATPEPSTIGMVLTGLAAALLRLRRRRLTQTC